MAKKYYDIANLLATDSEYNILLGERANGKSYQVKLHVLRAAFLDGVPFVYLRRWDRDIKQNAVTAYFADMPIREITHGAWEFVTAWQGRLYFAKRGVDDPETKHGKDEDLAIKKSNPIGWYCSLNTAERYKSWAFVNCESVVYEEFITDSSYLADEPRRLQQFVSTVARDRKIKVFMIGNTLSRVCPYFSEWGLEGTLRQKQGTIEIYHFHTGETTTNIAVEYCANSNTSKLSGMFFGTAARQIISGEWDVTDTPRLPRPLYAYENVFEVLLKYQSFALIMQLLVDGDGNRLVYVYPSTKGRKIERIITDTFDPSVFITRGFDLKRRPEFIMANCIRGEKVCYSDNLTAADFKNIRGSFPFV